MSMIENQVKELRKIAKTFSEWEYNRFYNEISEAADTIEALSAKREEQKWILCVDRFPEDKKTVLICGETGWMETGWRENGCWWTGFSLAEIQDDVVAWQPLPEPYHP